MDFLETILARKRNEVAELKASARLAELRSKVADMPPAKNLPAALSQGTGSRIIAEIKRKSPSKGWINPHLVAADIARIYESAGAAAISVLTDGPGFGGFLDDLEQARQAVSLPLLRKDFIIDPCQLIQARACGADAALLIVAALEKQALVDLIGEAKSLGLHILTEAHNKDEVNIAVQAGAKIIGINSRDLKTFEMDTDLAIKLKPRIPDDVVCVVESGIKSLDDLKKFIDAGYRAFLIGEAITSAPDIAAKLRSFTS